MPDARIGRADEILEKTMNRFPALCAFPLRAVLVIALVSASTGPASGQGAYKSDPQGKDELWDVTSKMEMPGMPIAMPAQTRRICAAKGNDAGTIPMNEGCAVVDMQRTGNKLTYRMNCKSGKNDYAATGESTVTAGEFQGAMRMAGKMDDQQMDMSMTYSGIRAGNCTLAPK
jgi:Protein of unknown function (DUF3617)